MVKREEYSNLMCRDLMPERLRSSVVRLVKGI